MERKVTVSWQALSELLKQSKVIAPDDAVKNISLVHPKELQLTVNDSKAGQ